VRVAFLGCGFVADYYATTFANHPELQVVGVHDRNAERARRFAASRGVERVYASFEDLLDDDGVELVLNLTDVASHHETTRACLLAGKHVYSEKPLATRFDQSEALVQLAEERGLSLSVAPCSVLSEAAQTTWKALRDGLPGEVRLIYAELDEGPIVRRDFRTWTSRSGVPWPFASEFQTGVALEHVGYVVSWLVAFFGPVQRVTAFASLLAPEKAPELPPDRMGPDFTVSCLEFASGQVARVTCGYIAEHDQRLRIFGENGVLSCRDVWRYDSPVFFAPYEDRRRLHHRVLDRVAYWTLRRDRHRLPLVRDAAFESEGPLYMDFARGVAEQAAAISEGRPPRLSARFSLHVNEVVLAMQPRPGTDPAQTIGSTCAPVEPMPWAVGLPAHRAGGRAFEWQPSTRPTGSDGS
jgi:predicted dehydrogenase